jgi:hypothetical protein
MEAEDTELAELERRISSAGWHIVRDVPDQAGFTVEFQHAPPTEFVPGAETRTSQGLDRADAYRRFLDDLAAEGIAARA